MALSGHNGTMARPLDVQEIVTQAKEFDFSTARPLQAWLRSAQMLMTEGAICEQDGDLQRAYLFLYRHAELILGKLPTHPGYKDPRYKTELSQARKAVQNNLAKLESWKPKISQEHLRYEKAMERRDAEKQRVEAERADDSDDGVFSDSGRMINANEHRQLAVDLAHREIQRRDLTRQSSRQAGISPNTVANRRRGMVQPMDGTVQEDVSQSLRDIGRQLNSSNYPRNRRSASSEYSPQDTSPVYSYPTVPRKEGSIDWNAPSIPPKPAQPLPSRPLKEPLPDLDSRTAPRLPPKAINTDLHPSPTQRTSSKYVFEPASFTENGKPLRTVMLPPELRPTFLNLAHANTTRNLETCGILCGTLISNALFINHLIIPGQTSTSDTCDTTEEGDNELFNYCDNADLLVCGWIHTHPSQSCFLSSRDLHTSSGYQIMLPEAIAIVCAPRHSPDWGIFRLTDPPGLPAVLNCHQKGLFHPHDERHLYTDALRPGHVVEGPGLNFEVVDLRK